MLDVMRRKDTEIEISSYLKEEEKERLYGDKRMAQDESAVKGRSKMHVSLSSQVREMRVRSKAEARCARHFQVGGLEEAGCRSGRYVCS
ncbi:hypothetical protein NDU88_008953 [Pleurodeles waltl]|uniref:Uncharacterized protein n=1 Tax=Pleurodeles waltl TaxID=8319 RepID=A0AAV7PQN5_PLEWA|nr:hypothetical protein NDU88_008953 [Pleurodeles waltl]